MTTGNGSVVVRRSLGRQLKALRIAAGKTATDVSAAGIASKTKLQRVEAGSVRIKMADVRTMCWLYGADASVTEKLAELALNTTDEGWWESFTDVMPPWFGMYVELEAAASQVFAYDPELIHGLLQTLAYSQAVSAADPTLTPETAQRHVGLRAERQRAAFGRTPPLQLTTVLGAGALTRVVGGERVMAEQRAHLLDISRQANFEVRVLPWDAGAHLAMKGAFNVLEFESPEAPSVVYLETYVGGRYVEQPKSLSTFRQMFEIISAMSVPIEEYLK